MFVFLCISFIKFTLFSRFFRLENNEIIKSKTIPESCFNSLSLDSDIIDVTFLKSLTLKKGFAIKTNPILLQKRHLI